MGMSRGQFNALWRIAMTICAILAVFTLLFVSCTRAPKGAEPIAAAPAEATPLPGSTVVLVTPEPEPSATEAPEIPPDGGDETTDNAPENADESLPDDGEDGAGQ